MSQEGRAVFALIKDPLSQSSQLVIMNEEDPLILYTDASKKERYRSHKSWSHKLSNYKDFILVVPYIQ